VDTNLYGGDSITLQAAIALVDEFGEGDAVLVKGSRVAGLERLVRTFGVGQ
jgi:UDP-N-acetylmuramyl pentapeptide synthase